MNEHSDPYRTGYIGKLHAVGTNLQRKTQQNYKEIGQGLKHIAGYLEGNPGLDPYSNEFLTVLGSMPIPEKSRWAAKQMRNDLEMTAAEATTKILQIKGRMHIRNSRGRML